MEKFIVPGSVALRLQFEESGDISLLQLSSILYDLTLLHDCIALTTISKYKEYKFSQHFWYREGRPLNPEHMLYVKKISHKSPITLVTAITVTAVAIGIPWVMLQAIDKIRNWKLNSEKLELEVKNLKLDNKQLYIENAKSKVDLESKLSERKAMETFLRITERIEKYKAPVIDAKFYVIGEDENDLPNPPQNKEAV